MARRRGRLAGRSAVRPERLRSGGCATLKIVWLPFLKTGNRGAKAKYGIDAGRRILALLDTPPPEGCANWTGPLIAEALGDIHVQHVWRFLRAQKIDLSGRKSWCVSNDPEFAAKAAEIVGLYLAPPDNAIVLAVDEKPSIQALERAQGYLKLPSGRALTGQSHDYKRHGTSGASAIATCLS